MKLKNLQVTNFRCFESLSIDLDEQLTVLVAKNGQGKSSVLDAIRIGLWPFVSGFDLARNPGSDSKNSISIDDVRVLKKGDGQMIRRLPCKVILQGDFDLQSLVRHGNEETWEWSRLREKETKGSKTRDDKISKRINKLANFSQEFFRSPDDSPDNNLPVFGYYGTGRLWNQKRLTESKKVSSGKQNADFFMRLFGYRDCLDPSSSYKHFADWFTWIFECYREDQIKQSEKGSPPETDSVWMNTIKVVQQAIDGVLYETGWHTLEYSVSNEKSLVLNHAEHGILKVELLSDGIRGVLAMVGDIAYRCIKLNPHLALNAAKDSHGVVMIDEVDMHLHPAWQQTILGNLVKAFPKIQFIVTTHSPQVISTVPSHQIRILDEGEAHSAEAGTQGAESSRILKRIFEVDPRPQNDPNTKKLNEYLGLVYADKWNDEEAKRKRKELDAIYQGNEPELTKADLYIENRQWELDVEKINKSSPPNNLILYAQNHPQDNWDDFRNSNQGADYQAIKQLIFNDQGDLYAFCENEVNNVHKQRVEHFHPKSDNSNQQYNWALDWVNVIGVCFGGEQSDQSIHPLPANLSCDAYKNYLIQKNKLPVNCEGYLLNPLELPAFPCLFTLDKRTGELKAKTDYEQMDIENNRYGTVAELVEKTIAILNLNCDRLNQQRLAVLNQYNQEIKKARASDDRQIHSKLAVRWFQKQWLSFFTTRRILLEEHAENYLRNINMQVENTTC